MKLIYIVLAIALNTTAINQIKDAKAKIKVLREIAEGSRYSRQDTPDLWKGKY